MSNRLNIPQGWQCPKCGNIYSPTWFGCNSCNNADAMLKERGQGDE